MNEEGLNAEDIALIAKNPTLQRLLAEGVLTEADGKWIGPPCYLYFDASVLSLDDDWVATQEEDV